MNHFSARYIDVGPTLDVPKTIPAEGHEISPAVMLLDAGIDRSREYPFVTGEERQRRIAALRKIEEQATEAWDTDQRAVAARDFMTIAIRRRKP